MEVDFLTAPSVAPDLAYLGKLVAHDGVFLGKVHDAERELESGVGLDYDN